MSACYVASNVTWIGTRVLLYGYFDVLLTVMFFKYKDSWPVTSVYVCFGLLLGRWLMFVLQVIWAGALVKHSQKFVKSGGAIATDVIDKGQKDQVAHAREDDVDRYDYRQLAC